jgi:hypothetical protein
MNLQTIASLAEIMSALAVTLTLIAVIISLRQNTKSQKALAVESLAAAVTAINVPGMESPALGAALGKATADWSSASREERMIAHFFLFFFQTIRERVVSTEGGHPRRGAVDWLGNYAAKILSRRWSAAGMVAGAQERLFAGISRVPFRNKPARRTQQSY